MEESEDFLAEVDKLSEQEKYKEVYKLRYKWMKREVEIFFPDMSEEELNSLTIETRDEIFAILFPPEEMPSEPSKKKESRGGKK